MAIGSVVVMGCVADNEHIAKSTGSTSQVWSTNSGTQPLTISCGFPAPYLAINPRGPRHFWCVGKCLYSYRWRNHRLGGQGMYSQKRYVTSVTGVTGRYKYLILKDFI